MKRLICLLAACALLLSGCASMPLEKEAPDTTLPPVREAPVAPAGDSQTASDSSAILYLPAADSSRLSAVVRTVTTEAGQPRQEALTQALLKEINESDFLTISQPLRLATVTSPVEVTGDLTTVDLGTSARLLSAEALFALRMAIVNTLTELPGTDRVNVLVGGRDVGLDVAMTLPTGVLSRYPSGEVSTYWTAIEAQRAAPEAGVQKTAALYFADADGAWMLAETRSVALTDRTLEGCAEALLREMAKGPALLSGALTLVPPEAYVERAPTIYAPAGSAARYCELFFRPETDAFLAAAGATRGMLAATLCYTLGSFLPGLDGVVLYIGGEIVSRLEMPDGSEWQREDGRLTREDCRALVADMAVLYYPLADGSGLRAVERPLAQRQRTQPRAILRALMEEPDEPTLAPAFPDGVSDADVLAIQIRGDTALLNLSSAFRDACAGLSEAGERGLVYAVVNTLTELFGVRRVVFYIEGTQGQLAGHLLFGGEFLRNPGMIR